MRMLLIHRINRQHRIVILIILLNKTQINKKLKIIIIGDNKIKIKDKI